MRTTEAAGIKSGDANGFNGLGYLGVDFCLVIGNLLLLGLKVFHRTEDLLRVGGARLRDQDERTENRYEARVMDEIFHYSLRPTKIRAVRMVALISTSLASIFP